VFALLLSLPLSLLFTPASAREQLTIVATTSDLASLAHAVTGNLAKVQSIIPPGSDPEEFQPRPQDLAKLRNANLLLRVGLDFELWLERPLAAIPNRQLQRGGSAYLDASTAVALLEIGASGIGSGDNHGHASGNPHYWLDPKNAEPITGLILEGLARVDPTNARMYAERRTTFLLALEKRIADWETRLTPLRYQPMIAYHNTWAYFARRFRLSIVDVIEIRPGVPPSTAHLARLKRRMASEGIVTILRQVHEPAREVAALAGRGPARIVVLVGSVGEVPQAPDYFSLFEHNVARLLATGAR
jgi:ABC-type Zn uptake system ZnuABC Zn-binding protein ZnuA